MSTEDTTNNTSHMVEDNQSPRQLTNNESTTQHDDQPITTEKGNDDNLNGLEKEETEIEAQELYDLIIESMQEIEGKDISNDDKRKEMYEFFVDSMKTEFPLPIFHYNLTDWYIGYMIRMFRNGVTEIKQEISSIIQFSINQIATFYSEESPLYLFNTWVQTFAAVFNDFESAIHIMEQTVRANGLDIHNWYKYINILYRLWKHETKQLQEEVQSKDKEGIDEKKEQEVIDKRNIERIRKLLNRMCFVMKGGDVDDAINACNEVVLFEQLNGSEKDIRNALKNRDEMVKMIQEKRLKFEQKEMKRVERYNERRKKRTQYDSRQTNHHTGRKHYNETKPRISEQTNKHSHYEHNRNEQNPYHNEKQTNYKEHSISRNKGRNRLNIAGLSGK
ncbi:Uncharacterized protein QTN25_010839 [Entamoeba marina]